jgi:hypothetical protein
LGIASNDNNAVFADSLRNVALPQYKPCTMIVGGCDEGLGTSAGSGETTCLVGTFSKYDGYDFFSEYSWDNKTLYKEPNEIAHEIVNYAKEEIVKYVKNTRDINRRNVVINVDFSAHAFISLLNTEAKKRDDTKCILAVQVAKKDELTKRAEIINVLMNKKKIRIDFKACPKLFQQLQSLKWASNRENPEGKIKT